MSDTPNITKPELLQIAWNQLDVRASLLCTVEELHALIQYDTFADDLPDNIVNWARMAIMDYITENEGCLSLPCDGNCLAHSDGVVLNCYTELLQEQHAETN